MSNDFHTWLATLSQEERDKFVEMLKDDNTYVAESVDDIIAILDQVREQKKTH